MSQRRFPGSARQWGAMPKSNFSSSAALPGLAVRIATILTGVDIHWFLASEQTVRIEALKAVARMCGGLQATAGGIKRRPPRDRALRPASRRSDGRNVDSGR